MKISDVVAHLRQYCPTLGGRVGIALDFQPERGQVKLETPAAVVFPAGDDAEPSSTQNVSVQSVEDRFAVVLILSTAEVRRGEETADALHLLRAEVWRALIGWVPGASYEPVEYLSGEVTSMDRSVTYYTLQFASELTVGHFQGVGDGREPETWQEYELAGLPLLEALDIAVDVIDPIADPNLQKPGPDGRVEFQVKGVVNHEDDAGGAG